jgi:hypothetical protein
MHASYQPCAFRIPLSSRLHAAHQVDGRPRQPIRPTAMIPPTSPSRGPVTAPLQKMHIPHEPSSYKFALHGKGGRRRRQGT